MCYVNEYENNSNNTICVDFHKSWEAISKSYWWCCLCGVIEHFDKKNKAIRKKNRESISQYESCKLKNFSTKIVFI